MVIISLYAGGMTLRDIQHHLVSTICTELSHETLSKITDQVAEEGWPGSGGPRNLPLLPNGLDQPFLDHVVQPARR